MMLWTVTKSLLGIPGDLWKCLITYWPGPLGRRLRYNYWKKRLGYLGAKTKIDEGVHFQNPSSIRIGSNCWLDRHVIILAGLDKSSREKKIISNKAYKGSPGEVFIGDNTRLSPYCIVSGIDSGVFISDSCSFSANCKIYSFTHHFRSTVDPSDRSVGFGPQAMKQFLISGPIYVGPNCGFALNTIILPGVAINSDSFVAINSVVRGGKFPPNSMISGNPAKRIATRYKSD